MTTTKVCVCLIQGEVSARKVWRFNPDDIDSYCVEAVERELLELFPKVKLCGLSRGGRTGPEDPAEAGPIISVHYNIVNKVRDRIYVL